MERPVQHHAKQRLLRSPPIQRPPRRGLDALLATNPDRPTSARGSPTPGPPWKEEQQQGQADRQDHRQRPRRAVFRRESRARQDRERHRNPLGRSRPAPTLHGFVKMTTTYWVVNVEVEPEQAQECAEKVKRWLIQEGIVLPTPPEPTEVFPVDSASYPRHLLA